VIGIVQRVSSASVSVGDSYEARIGKGFVILVGVARGDDDEDARWLAHKCAGLRVFNDASGKMNLDLDAIGGEALVVSQFTLMGDCEKGRRPSFIDAAGPSEADRLYTYFVGCLRGRGIRVQTGVFQAMMQVTIVNDGPVTLIVDSGPWKRRRSAG
jgi:D-aminoacyl-tRNA deacylase